MHPGNTDALFDMYREELERSMINDPRAYPVIGCGSIPAAAERVASKMRSLVLDKGEQVVRDFQISTPTWQRTCKRVGIRCTYKAIQDYLA